MSLHLITGYAGVEHVTSADQGAYNMGTFGEGQFVLNRGAKFAATVVTNNSVSIADGEALMQGRFINMTMGTSEAVSIDNGASGMKRNDLIVIRYSKDSGTGIESAALAVIKGTPSSTTPSDPSYTEGDITDGTDLVNEMPLYRVSLDGLNIDSITALFAVKTTMVDYMENYQLPTASSSVLGGIKVGNNLSIDAEGKLSAQNSYVLPTATSLVLGGVKVPGTAYAGIKIENGTISVRQLTHGVTSNSVTEQSLAPNTVYQNRTFSITVPAESGFADRCFSVTGLRLSNGNTLLMAICNVLYYSYNESTRVLTVGADVYVLADQAVSYNDVTVIYTYFD